MARGVGPRNLQTSPTEGRSLHETQRVSPVLRRSALLWLARATSGVLLVAPR